MVLSLSLENIHREQFELSHCAHITYSRDHHYQRHDYGHILNTTLLIEAQIIEQRNTKEYKVVAYDGGSPLQEEPIPS
jgi:hypothetical protein